MRNMRKAMMTALLCLGAFAAFSGDGAKPAASSAKSDQCWAMTQSGNRCKRRARPNERYCRQHSASVAPSKPVERCRSMTEEGRQCPEKPMDGKRYCPKHMSAE